MKAKIFIMLLVLSFIALSCNEDEWLQEEVFDFYSVENSYETPEQFHAAVTYLYNSVPPFTNEAPFINMVFFYTSDIAFDAISLTHQMNSYADALTPETSVVRTYWERFYDMVLHANVILNRIENENVEFSSEEARLQIKAEASFFRAYAYRNLGIMYGGVPLVLEEISEPKRDFERATKEEVMEQCIADLLFAAENLPSVSEINEEGRLTKAAAYHLMTEIYIITESWDDAINAASQVINNPNYSLMTERFGTKNEAGDPYFDLFRRGNQNRTSGNNEAIWVHQYEYMVEGGGSGYNLTGWLTPNAYLLSGDDGKQLFIGPTSQHGGRGIGWVAPSDYLLNQIWEMDFNDMRNSQYNIIRDIAANNPESKYFGQKIVENGLIVQDPTKLDVNDRRWSAIFSKTTPINDFPSEVILNSATGLVSNSANQTFRDHYVMRLAETYLLRAEAYFGKGDLAKAAEDINVVRQRANATPISSGDVNIDFILDERARELYFEELRIMTLMRMGKLVERVKTYDPMHNGKYANNGIYDHQNLWPIPQSEIERNTEALLQQNPGYN